jgi:PadR family transcriptional regulator AphA
MLSISPSYGYELHQQIDLDLRYVWKLSLSQVYNVLTRLEAQGLIRGEVREQQERPDRKQFELTPEGIQHLQAWFDTPVGASLHAVRIAFLSKLYLAQRLPDFEIKSLFEKQRVALEKGLTSIKQTLTKMDPSLKISRNSLRLRISQLQSLLSWLTEFEKEWIK